MNKKKLVDYNDCSSVHDEKLDVWPTVTVRKYDAKNVQVNKTLQFRHYV